MGQTPNICAGPFGALYSFYVERPWLMQVIGRTLWGIDTSVLYDSIRLLEEVREGSTVSPTARSGSLTMCRPL